MKNDTDANRSASICDIFENVISAVNNNDAMSSAVDRQQLLSLDISSSLIDFYFWFFLSSSHF